jgi:NADH:ubiquinone oxidoreductase subunit 3 (subunit A)
MAVIMGVPVSVAITISVPIVVAVSLSISIIVKAKSRYAQRAFESGEVVRTKVSSKIAA